jgi:hypothetical protein
VTGKGASRGGYVKHSQGSWSYKKEEAGSFATAAPQAITNNSCKMRHKNFTLLIMSHTSIITNTEKNIPACLSNLSYNRLPFQNNSRIVQINRFGERQ